MLDTSQVLIQSLSVRASRNLLQKFYDVVSHRWQPGFVAAAILVGKRSQVPRTERRSAMSFQMNDLVWAKLKGYPWWPGLIADGEELLSLTGNRSFVRRDGYAIRFLGSND